MMSISEQELHTLDSIEDELAHSSPRLTSMLAMFSRLSAGEQMPVRAPVLNPAWLWFVALAALLALMVTLTHGTRGSQCTHSRITACQRTPAGFPSGVKESGR